MIKKLLAVLLTVTLTFTLIPCTSFAATYSTDKITAADLEGMKNADIIELMGPLFTADEKNTGVLACVSMAQFILESGYGKSPLALNSNNCFGMKASLSGSSWKGSTWDGSSVYTIVTNEQKEDGTVFQVTANFRSYPSINDSIADHSAYLCNAWNSSKGNYRYSGISGETDYRTAAQIIKDGGYATSISYVDSLCSIIEKWDLTRFNFQNSWVDQLTDVDPSEWYYPVLPKVHDIMSGVSETEFAPNDPMTRAMFVTILYRLSEDGVYNNTYNRAAFSDVTADDWCFNEVNWAYRKGIAKGVDSKNFAPNEPITREQMAVMLQNFMKYQGTYVSNTSTTKFKTFWDYDRVSSWAKDSMIWAINTGLINGTGYGIEPAATATRAQVAKLICNYREKY